jgi:hypothetical protein
MGVSRPVEIYLIELAAFNANPIKNSHNTVVTETYVPNFWELQLNINGL